MMKWQLIDLKSFGDERGKLISFQENINCPFDVKRIFYIFDTKGEVARGCHANRNSEFLFVLISGSCKIKVDDGQEVVDITLKEPNKALYIDKMIWKEMYDFSYNAILLVLTNTRYDENEYIRDYKEFCKIMG